MLFSTGFFILLWLPLYLAIHHALPLAWRPVWILAASWVFYAWWRVDFLALLVGATTLTWALGRAIAARAGRRSGAARAALVAGVVANLGVLAYFKYADFGIGSLNAVLGTIGAGQVPALRLVLPVGISFYVFKAVSYLVDVHRRLVPAAGGYLDVAVYIALFPQVIAGPISRYGDLVPQLGRLERSFPMFSEGALRFMLGFCKKALIADVVAPIANVSFGLSRPTFIDAWLGAGAYTIQIYFDFSGYSDMAIGLCLMMGLRTAENFRTPYLSTSIGEFWRRWHISLSSWLRDYLYIPLGGSRSGLPRTCLNLFTVMLLGGLWHGSAWTYVMWGAWHGLLLVGERLIGTAPRWPKLPAPIATVTTMLAVVAGWVLFRAPSAPGALAMYAGMLGARGFGLSLDMRWQVSELALAVAAVSFVSMFAGPWLGRRADRLSGGWGWAADHAWLCVLPLFVLGLVRIMAESYAPFLYVKF